MKNKFSQVGMTFIEIMIALLIGSILLGGVLQVFLGSKQTYRMQQALSRMQENGRFALDFLAKDIRMAGFLGCNSQITPFNTLNGSTAFLYDFSKAVEGFESTTASDWTPTLQNNAAITEPLGGTDIITIRRAGDQSFFVEENNINTKTLTLDLTATEKNLQAAGFLNNESMPANNCAIAVVADFTNVAIFQVSDINGYNLYYAAGGTCTMPGNDPNKNLNDPNETPVTYKGGQIYPINTISFFIKKNIRKQPALYRSIGSNNAEELIEGIENMQIVYGVDLASDPDKTPDYYISADQVQVTDWPNVVSVQISLLAVSLDDNLAAQPVSYTFNGITTNDRKIRRVFNTTIALRNRL